MAVKLSSFLSTSLADALDSAATVGIILDTTIPLDSNTSGNYVKDITAGSGISVSGGGAHSATPTVEIDSAVTATVATAQTLTNKTINLSNNTLSTTLGQLNAAISGSSVASLNGTETLTNKTLTSPTINSPSITGPGSITSISTFGLRDATTSVYDTRIVSNNASPALSANRTLTLDVNNADRTISLTGNLTLAGSFTTSGAHNTTLTTAGATSVTLPTSGTLVSKDGSGDVSISGTMTAASYEGDGSSLSGISSYTTGDFDSDFDSASTDRLSEGSTNLYYTTARFDTRFSSKSTSNLSEGTNLYYTDARVRSAVSVTDAGGDGSLSFNSSNGVITYTGPSAAEVRAHFSAGEGIDISSGAISGENATTSNKGIASFNTNDFSVSSGAVSIKTGGVSNTQLAGSIANGKLSNSAITINGSSVSLGGTRTLVTDDIAEDGSPTNLWYTTARANSAIDARVTKSFVDALNINADLLDGNHGSHYRIDVYDASGSLLN